MYIFDLLKKDGWTSKEKPAGDNTNFIQVIYCPECDKKTAVEGEDKFTGYPALAQWAYENVSSNTMWLKLKMEGLC